MNWILSNIRWIMIVCGALEATLFCVVIAPAASLQLTFGETLSGPLAMILVRYWGVLIALTGAMLIYGAFHPAQRPLILTVAAISKATFIGLMLSEGRQYLAHPAGVAFAVDFGMMLLFAWYLLAARSQGIPAPNGLAKAAQAS